MSNFGVLNDSRMPEGMCPDHMTRFSGVFAQKSLKNTIFEAKIAYFSQKRSYIENEGF